MKEKWDIVRWSSSIVAFDSSDLTKQLFSNLIIIFIVSSRKKNPDFLFFLILGSGFFEFLKRNFDYEWHIYYHFTKINKYLLNIFMVFISCLMLKIFCLKLCSCVVVKWYCNGSMQFQFVSLQTKLLLRLLKEMVSQYVVISLFSQANVCVFYYVFFASFNIKEIRAVCHFEFTWYALGSTRFHELFVFPIFCGDWKCVTFCYIYKWW